MSFKKSWQNVEERTFAFNRGAGDSRKPETVLAELSGAVSDLWDAIEDGDPKCATLPGFSAAEERLAAIVTDIMHLSFLRGYDIPAAMAARNSRIRGSWREKQVDATPRPVKTGGHETKQREGQGTQVRSRSTGSTPRPRTRTSTG